MSTNTPPVTSQKVIPGNTPEKVTDTAVIPYCYVGLLTMVFPNDEEYIGTATVIPEPGKKESYYVLTCAHNLYDIEDGGEVKKVTFQRAYSDTETIGEPIQDPYPPVNAVAWYYPEGYENVAVSRTVSFSSLGSDLKEANINLDYAVVKLAAPVEIEDYNFLTVETDDVLQDLDVQINGYGYYGEDKGEGMSHATGKITEVTDLSLRYPISTKQGASGSAILMDNNVNIVGIHTRKTDEELNQGVRITADVKAQIEAWMKL